MWSTYVHLGRQVKDALQEVLNDDSFQHAIQKDVRGVGFAPVICWNWMELDGGCLNPLRHGCQTSSETRESP